MTTIIVREVTDRKQWDTFLWAHPQGHLLQSYDWGELHQSLGHSIHRLGAFEYDNLVGAMMITTAPLPIPILGKYCTWLYCSRGPALLYNDANVFKALVSKAHDIATTVRAIVLKIEPNILVENAQEWQKTYAIHGFRVNPLAIHGRRSWVLDIRPEEEQIIAGCSKTWRRYIRQGERQGLEVYQARTDKDFDEFYRLLVLTSQRDNFFIHSKEYHREMYQRYVQQGNAAIFLANYRGKPVAARMVIRFGDTCIYMYGASDTEDRSIPNTHIVQYRCIQWAKEQGCSTFDFRVIPDILDEHIEMYGVYYYKKGFGGFSRLHMETQDYVYNPIIYSLWRTLVKRNRASRQHKYQKEWQRKMAEQGKQELEVQKVLQVAK